MAVTACLVLLETLLLSRPWLMYRAMKPPLFFQVLLCPAWLAFSLLYARAASASPLGRLDKPILLFSLAPLLFALGLPGS